MSLLPPPTVCEYGSLNDLMTAVNAHAKHEGYASIVFICAAIEVESPGHELQLNSQLGPPEQGSLDARLQLLVDETGRRGLWKSSIRLITMLRRYIPPLILYTGRCQRMSELR
ncbi:MAG: hypothetical protein M1826_000451 [Phylliscum demangeonii]|nr:MAG: hypothetical protein M1826_000451 [Phylliscum demangeonii]